MSNARRPLGRLFHWFLLLVVLGPFVAPVRAAGPNTTTVVDVIYRGDGSAAQGTLLISWPAFTAKGSEPVAAGSLSVKIGPGGNVQIPLVPNTGATPAGTHYNVVMKLDDGTTSTEYWTVPDAGTTTVSAIRSKVVPATVAAQLVARDYVDSVLAGVNGDFVVHKSGAETITGAKQFVTPPTVPAPVADGDAANKSYVDVTAQKAASAGALAPSASIPAVGSAGAMTLLTTGAKGAYFYTGTNWSPFHTELSITDFGAVGDAKSYFNSSITQGSKTLTSWGFTSSDIGKKALIAGAGPSGADLVSTITGVTSNTVATINDAAGKTVNAAGALWGKNVDDTTAFAAALTNCKGDQSLNSRSGGCTLRIGPGTYAIEATQVIANWNNYSAQNRVTIECIGGYAATTLVWTGADLGDMFQVDDSTAKAPPVTIKGCGFMGLDASHRLGAPMHAVGGAMSMRFLDNHVGANTMYGVQFSQIFGGSIERNFFYGPVEAVRFDNSCNTFSNALGHGNVGCPVNGITVAGNEFGLNASYSIHSLATGQGGSNGNIYGPNNDFEGTLSTAKAALELNDVDSRIFSNRFEDSGSTDPAYRSLRMTGGRNEVTNNNFNWGVKGIVSGGSNIFTGNYIGTFETSASETEPDLMIGNKLTYAPTTTNAKGLLEFGNFTDWRPGYQKLFDNGHISLKEENEATNPQKTITQLMGKITYSIADAILVGGKSVPDTPAGAEFGWGTYTGQFSSIVWNDKVFGCNSSYPWACVLGWVCQSTSSSDHCISTGGGNYSQGTWLPISFPRAKGTATLGTSSIAAGACATVVTVSAPGTTTADSISFTPTADWSGLTGYGTTGTLKVYPYPTADNVNFKVCNADGTNAVTPSAASLNWVVQ